MKRLNTNFGKWLRSFMIEHDISVKNLSDISGLSERRIRQWTNGTAQPRFISGIFIIITLSKLTGTDEKELYSQISYCILKDN